MKRYDDDDIVTFYFVINDNGVKQQIQGWTDDRDLAKAYMDFHRCKNFRMRSITKKYIEILKILEENNNDEIKVVNLTVADDSKKKRRAKIVAAPLTDTESQFVNEECASFMSSTINYSIIDSALPYMHKKYQKIFRDVLLIDAIDKAIHNRHPKSIESIQLDEMRILLRSFPDNFGE